MKNKELIKFKNDLIEYITNKLTEQHDEIESIRDTGSTYNERFYNNIEYIRKKESQYLVRTTCASIIEFINSSDQLLVKDAPHEGSIRRDEAERAVKVAIKAKEEAIKKFPNRKKHDK